MPVRRVQKSAAAGGGVGVPAGKLSVSLLSSCRGSGLVGRTSHELEGHGHALLIVRHVCGISGGYAGAAAAVWVVEWRRAGLRAGVCDRALEVVDEGGSRLAGSRCARAKPSFVLASCDSNSQDGRMLYH